MYAMDRSTDGDGGLIHITSTRQGKVLLLSSNRKTIKGLLIQVFVFILKNIEKITLHMLHIHMQYGYLKVLEGVINDI